jgi:hypothetical protein
MIKILVVVLCVLYVITLATSQTYEVQWARQAPQEGDDGNSTVTAWGNDCFNASSYQCGWLTGTSTFGDLTAVGSDDHEQAFIVKYSPEGNEEWVHVVNSTGPSRCYGVSVVEGGVLFAGFFNGDVVGWISGQSDITGTSSDGDLTIGFVARVSTDGTTDDFKVIGNQDDSSSTSVRAVDTDSQGNVFVFGNFNGTITFGENEFNSELGGDVFFASYSPDNGLFLFGNTTGGAGFDGVSDANTNHEGFSCVVGQFNGRSDFAGTEETDDTLISSYVMGLESDGTVAFITTFAGAQISAAYISDIGHCSFVGTFLQNITGDDIDTINVPGFGGFFGRVNNLGAVTLFNTSSGEVDDEFNDVTCDDSNGDCFIIGSYWTNITFGDVSLESTDDDPDLVIFKVSMDGVIRNHLQAIGTETFGSNICNTGQTVYAAAIFAQQVTIGSFDLNSPSNTSLGYFNWARSDVQAS